MYYVRVACNSIYNFAAAFPRQNPSGECDQLKRDTFCSRRMYSTRV